MEFYSIQLFIMKNFKHMYKLELAHVLTMKI